MRDEGLTKRDASRHPLNGKISVRHASLLPHGSSLIAHPFLPHPCSSVAKEGLRKRDASRHPLNGKISVPHASLLAHGASLMAHPFLPLRSLRLCGESYEDHIKALWHRAVAAVDEGRR